MSPDPPSQAELERQRADIEAAFSTGWVPEGVGQPRTLTVADCAEARRLMAGGGLSYLEPSIIQAVRDGAQPGDPLPPRERRPFIKGVSNDAEVIITTAGAWRGVAVLFSHEGFPGVRFGHRFTPPSDEHAAIWLMENIETGGLHRMMQAPQPANDAGIIWTTWGAAPSDP